MSAGIPHPQVLRGLQLKQLGRYADAASAFKEALAQEPNDAFALHQLAGCQWRVDELRKEALETIERAIAIEPNEAEHHVLRGFILCALDRPKEALDATRIALGLDPNDSYAFTAEAQAYLQMEKWPLAEQSARQALALDADNSGAANQLAQALRLQNKQAENAAHLAGMLARDPEDAFTHANAGWAALQRGVHREAEMHFREALRLDPDFDYAREGLLTSFRARSPLYRAYLNFDDSIPFHSIPFHSIPFHSIPFHSIPFHSIPFHSIPFHSIPFHSIPFPFAMARLNRGARWAVILGLYFGVRVARALPGGVFIVALYFLFVLWVWVARPVGNTLLLFDRFARYALRLSEKIEAAVVTGCLAIGLASIVLSFAIDSDIAMLFGIASIAIAFPLSLVFTNASIPGRWVFGGIAAGAALVIAGGLFLGSHLFADLFVGACIACAASTWLGNIRALNRRG